MAIRSENLIASLLFSIDEASVRKARGVRSELGGDIRTGAGIDVDQRSFDKAEKSVGGFASGLKRLAGIGAAIGLASLGKQAFDLSAQFEQTQVAFSTFLGSTEEATRVIAELEKFSLTTPFEPDQVLKAGQALLAFGEPVETLTESLGRIGDISAGTGKDFNELAVIFGKARISGTLFAEDINQLTESGVPIIQEFAKQLGVSESAVKKLASEGKISFANLEEAFVSLTSEGGKFFNLTLRQSNTIGGLLSTASGAFSALLRSAGDAILPIAREILPPLINGLFSLVNAAKSVAQPIASFFIGAFNVIKQALAPVIESVQGFFARFSSGKGVLERFRPVLDFLARTLVFLGIQTARVIDVFGGLIDFIRGQLGGNSLIGRFASFIGNAFSNIPAIVNGVYEVFFALPTAIGNALKRATLQVRAFVSDLATALNPVNLGRAVIDGFGSLDFSAGNALRAQASKFESFGNVISDAFQEGFDKINDVKFEFGEIATPEAIETVNKEGEDLGAAVADGIEGKLKEKLPEGSLAALKKALSEVESELDIIANKGVFDGKGIDKLRSKIQEIADKKEEIELLEKVIDRIANPSLGAIGGFSELRTELGITVEEKTVLAQATTAIDELRSRLPALKARIDITTDPETLKKLQSEYQQILGTLREYDPELKEISSLVDKLNKEIVERGGIFNLTEGEAEKAKEAANLVIDSAKDLTSKLLEQQVKRKDDEIAIQEQRLSELLGIADQGNAEQLQLEQERLRSLRQERENALAAQRRIAAAEIAINTALSVSQGITAITKAFAQGNAVAGVLTGIALAAQVAGAILTISSAFSSVPSFYKGTESVPGATTKGTIIEAHGKERILTAEQNKPLLKLGVRNKDIPSLVEMGLMFQGAKVRTDLMQPAPDQANKELKEQNKQIMRELKRTRLAISSLKVEQSIDGRGVRQMVDTEGKKVERRKNLRR